MTKIKLTPYLGTTTKDRLLPGPFEISITLTERFLVSFSKFDTETPKFEDDEYSGYVEYRYNDLCYIPKEMIVQMGSGYDNECGSYFVAVEKASGKINSWNVESHDKADELLSQMVEWWQS